MCTACLVSSGSTSSNLLGDEEIIMRALAEGEFVQQAKPAYDRVFGTENPFESSFAPTIEARMILFPVHYMMERPLARAIEKASPFSTRPHFTCRCLKDQRPNRSTVRITGRFRSPISRSIARLAIHSSSRMRSTRVAEHGESCSPMNATACLVGRGSS